MPAVRRFLLAPLLSMALISVLAMVLAAPSPGVLTSQAAELDSDIDISPDEIWTGDLPGMIERQQIRVLVTYSKTGFFVVDGQGRGFEHDLLREFETFLNKDRKKQDPRISVIFIPVAFDELLPALREGRGDIAAASLTVNEARAKKVAFSAPYVEDVDEILVSHKDAPDYESWEDLAGAEVYVRRASSHVENMKAVSRTLDNRRLKPIKVVEADASLHSEDLMEMVNAGLIDFAVIDDHKAELWTKLLPELKLQTALTVNQDGEFAWAVRKNSPTLLGKLNEFVREVLPKRVRKVRSLYNSYFETTVWAKNPTAMTFSPQVHRLIPYFQEYSERYGVPWLLMMAQGFQESSLDPDAISSVGAVGIMQVLPSTAKDLGFDDIHPVEPNIHAGIKYMRWIVDHYFDDEDLPASERAYLALAAYNAGANRIARLREKAPELGLDPNIWFGNMEIVVLMHVGREPVRYVSNINKYYITYSAMQKVLAEHGKTPVDIADLQEFLNAKGYDAGDADGVIGQRTRAAIRRYQRNHGLAETGEPSISLIRHLRDS